jgi:hypothetical protein
MSGRRRGEGRGKRDGEGRKCTGEVYRGGDTKGKSIEGIKRGIEGTSRSLWSCEIWYLWAKSARGMTFV